MRTNNLFTAVGCRFCSYRHSHTKRAAGSTNAQNLPNVRSENKEKEKEEQQRKFACVIFVVSYCSGLVYVSYVSAIRWIFRYPFAFIFNNKMLNKQAACAHEMHRQMIPLLQTFSLLWCVFCVFCFRKVRFPFFFSYFYLLLLSKFERLGSARL